MRRYILNFQEIDRSEIAIVGGKGANLGELSKIEGLSVPAGFCVTTSAYRRIVTESDSIDAQLDRLSQLTLNDTEGIERLSAEIRLAVEAIAVPDELVTEILESLEQLGGPAGYAVRSSATAEDLPTASFAGQHDTTLNVVGSDAILLNIRLCWASMFSERAVTYRLRNGVDHRKVLMAVVVQQMASPKASGVIFTADPVTGNRKIASIEAIQGLGEQLVSGLVNPDTYRVRGDMIVAKRLASEPVTSEASLGKVTRLQRRPVLIDAEAIRLALYGRQIESHFGRPQDIEWCLVEGDFQFVQSRPITTLFPIPETDDGENHVYISVGHQQMMTDAMKPLGISFWQLTTPRPMAVAGGRLFVDVTRQLASPAIRPGFLDMVGRSDPLIRDALQTVLDRGDFIQELPDEIPAQRPSGNEPDPIAADPAIVAGLIERTQASVAKLQHDIQMLSGTALLDFILADIPELRRILFDPLSHQAIMAGMEATWWLNDQLEAWLGEKNAADTLAQSVPNNITSEMGLALLDVADAIRPYPDVVDYLQQVEEEDFLDGLIDVEGGRAARDAIADFLDRYGMRCAGEIDITRPRWSERPTALLPLILGNVRNFSHGDGERRFEMGRQAAQAMEGQLIERLRTIPDGERKAEQTKGMIDRVRTFIGYREYPKYGMVSRYFVYKRALMKEAERLVQAKVLREAEDICYLTLQELQNVMLTGRVDEKLIRQRNEAFRSYQALVPPRVLTSDGEMVAGSYWRGDLPSGAIAGLPVSAGTIEGRARVILDMTKAVLEPGDILVTTFTDPSWTPLFVAISGLVTEVGGLMTHGAVIAREYGLPAVVGVQHATKLIRDGQRIRLNGTDGYVEIISGETDSDRR